jgi:hypothetical protein
MIFKLKNRFSDDSRQMIPRSKKNWESSEIGLLADIQIPGFRFLGIIRNHRESSGSIYQLFNN